MTEKDELSPLLAPSILLSRENLDFQNGLILWSRWQSFGGVCFFVSVVGTTYAYAVYRLIYLLCEYYLILLMLCALCPVLFKGGNNPFYHSYMNFDWLKIISFINNFCLTIFISIFFSELLKENLQFSQSDLDIIASVGNAGLYLSIVAGFLLDKFGIKYIVTMGAFFILLGFLYIFLAIQQLIPTNVYCVSVVFFLSQFGVCCHVSSAVTFCIRLFPAMARGSAVGLGKGYFALSSAVLGTVSEGFFSSDPSYFVLFIALFIPCFSIVGSQLADPLPPHLISFDYEHQLQLPTSMRPFFLHFFLLFASVLTVGYLFFAYNLPSMTKILITVCLLVMITTLLLLPAAYGPRLIAVLPTTPSGDDSDHRHHRRDSVYDPSPNTSILVISNLSRDVDEDTAGPTSTIIRAKSPSEATGGEGGDSLTNEGSVLVLRHNAAEEGHTCVDWEQNENGSNGKNTHRHAYSSLPGSTVFISSDQLPVKGIPGITPSASSSSSPSPQDCYYGEGLPLLQSVLTWRFWSVYVTFMVMVGSALMVIDNIDAIAEAVNCYPSTFFVTLVSLANSLGRVVAGSLSDSLVGIVSKPVVLATVCFLMGVAHSLFAIGSQTLLYPCLLLVGFLFGCCVSLTAVCMADIFGSKYIATNFGATDSASIFGSFIFVYGVVALFYQTNTYDDDGSSTCIGTECFRIPFIITSICCYAGSALSINLHLQTSMGSRTAHFTH